MACPTRRRPSLFNGHVLTGLFHWMGAQGWIATRSDGVPFVAGIPMSIVWWLGITALAGYILTRTRYGNWIFATGGDADVARNVGVPVDRVKISLFICTACAATLLATIQVMEAGSADTTARPAQGIRGDHRRGHRRRAADRRLRHGLSACCSAR